MALHVSPLSRSRPTLTVVTVHVRFVGYTVAMNTVQLGVVHGDALKKTNIDHITTPVGSHRNITHNDNIDTHSVVHDTNVMWVALHTLVCDVSLENSSIFTQDSFSFSPPRRLGCGERGDRDAS